MSSDILREDAIIARAKRTSLLMMTARSGASQRALNEELDFLAGLLWRERACKAKPKAKRKAKRKAVKS